MSRVQITHEICQIVAVKSLSKYEKINFWRVFAKFGPTLCRVREKILTIEDDLDFSRNRQRPVGVGSLANKNFEQILSLQGFVHHSVDYYIIELTTCFQEFFENESPIFFNNNIS